MTSRRSILATIAALPFAAGFAQRAAAAPGKFPVAYPDAVWKQRLGADAYYVLRQSGTERAGTSPLNGEHSAGTFACKGCALPLFSSRTKYDSGTGWPSFWQALPGVAQSPGSRLSMFGIEVHCARCGGHLGHIFDDGPKPTGKRYCINGVALTFTPAKA